MSDKIEEYMPLQAFGIEDGKIIIDVIHLDDPDRGTNRYRISPRQARGLATVLLELANEADE